MKTRKLLLSGGKKKSKIKQTQRCFYINRELNPKLSEKEADSFQKPRECLINASSQGKRRRLTKAQETELLKVIRAMNFLALYSGVRSL